MTNTMKTKHMKTTKHALLVVTFLFLGMGQGVVYGDSQAGFDAANRGDFATALREWKPLAEAGDANAQYNLGVMYSKGEGVLQDYKEAVKWYLLAAEQGDANAQFNLGVMYRKGEGVLQDDKEAAKWYLLAAEQGYASAQYNLGLMYAKGEGVLQDDVKAHMWWNIAASLGGHETAAENRGIIEKRMTPSQREKAQEMARRCVEKNYKGC